MRLCVHASDHAIGRRKAGLQLRGLSPAASLISMMMMRIGHRKVFLEKRQKSLLLSQLLLSLSCLRRALCQQPLQRHRRRLLLKRCFLPARAIRSSGSFWTEWPRAPGRGSSPTSLSCGRVTLPPSSVLSRCTSSRMRTCRLQNPASLWRNRMLRPSPTAGVG